MKPKLIGRKKEVEVLKKALASSQPELVSIVGRRRVGKTFLIQSVYEKNIFFELTGIQHAPRLEQLQNFTIQLTKYSNSVIPITPPKNWLDAFFMLSQYLETKIKSKKAVVFLDELPWMATKKSGFLRGLGWFWNSWATKKNVVIVICGSAASWMIQKVVRDKVGLHNRITRRITLEPFNLHETELFLKNQIPNIDRYQILQIYMAMGGIPHYLKEIEGGKSAVQNIDQICFSKTGLLNSEFSLLYPALFENSEEHIKVIRSLAAKRKGLTRKEIIEIGKLSDGGNTSKVIEELNHSGFISPYYTFGRKKRELRFRLTDEYSLFYLRFIETNSLESEDIWDALSQNQSYKIWCGFAFENLCLKHIPNIKKALGISGIYARSTSFFKKGDGENSGVQIDLLIDRNDRTINLVEIKFHNGTFTISKDYAQKLRDKIQIFKEASKTKKQVFLTFISALGLKSNIHSIGLVDNDFDGEIFFKE